MKKKYMILAYLEEPSIYLDLGDGDFLPDSATIDSQGNLWNAQWESSRVSCYDIKGQLIKTVLVPVSQVSCPCISDTDQSTLFITAVRKRLEEEQLLATPLAGATFTVELATKGQLEYKVIL